MQMGLNSFLAHDVVKLEKNELIKIFKNFGDERCKKNFAINY